MGIFYRKMLKESLPDNRIDFRTLDPDLYDTDALADLITKRFVDKVIGVYKKCQFIVNNTTDFEKVFKSNDLESKYIGSQIAECIMGLAIIDVSQTNENPYDYSWYDFNCQKIKCNNPRPGERGYSPLNGSWCNYWDTTTYQVCQDWINAYETEYNQICASVLPLKLTLHFYWEIIHIWSGGYYDSLDETENIKIKDSNITMNSFDKKWEQKMDALHESNDTYKRNALNESVEEDELIDFATKNYFNRWFDCDADPDDLCDALLDGLYGKDFRQWDRIYGFGKDYEYLECAYKMGVNAASAADFEEFKALYESKNSALQTFRKSYSAKANKSLFEGKALTSEEKMDRWHNGSRKENIKACSEEKLKEYRKICRAKGYAEEAKQINAELRARKSVSESFVLEAKSDNSGLRNSVLYGFLLRKVAPIVAATVTEAGFAANVHDSSASKDKVADVKVDIKGRGINGINKLNINYYNPGEPVMGVSNSKFASGSVKTDPTFGLAFVSEERVYIIPKPILQRNWGKLMSTDRSIQMVKDALGMRSEITICDASKMMELAENEGYVYTMSAANAAKYRTELNKYLGVEDANAPVTESLSEAEDPFAVEPVPGEAGKYLAKKILQNTLYAIEDPQKRQSCLNNYKKVFLSGDNSEFKSFVLEIQTRIKQGDNNW
jgi:predicted HicB family RNase H-like nuclease